MAIKATFHSVDFWSRCLIQTEKGTILCDTNCLDPEAIKADVNSGDWHTYNTEWEEPHSRIDKSKVTFHLDP